MTLDEIAFVLRSTGFFLDAAALPGADRIVAIDQAGKTHTWTHDQVADVLKHIKILKKMKPAVDTAE